LASVENVLPPQVQKQDIYSKRSEIQLRETRNALNSSSERIRLILDEMEDYFYHSGSTAVFYQMDVQHYLFFLSQCSASWNAIATCLEFRQG